mgnify:CR=1 FL=1
MRMYNLILKKRQGNVLTKDEIDWMIREYTDGRIPDYQMSAMMMAICFQGLDKEETYELTMAMAQSGEMLSIHVKMIGTSALMLSTLCLRFFRKLLCEA